MALVAALLALPLVGLAVLLAAPDADVHWQHQPSHFWLVLLTAGLNADARLRDRGGGAPTRRPARPPRLALLPRRLRLPRPARAGDARVLLDKPNLGFVIATPIGLLLAGGTRGALGARPRARAAEAARARAADRRSPSGRSRRWRCSPRSSDSAVPDRLSLPLVALVAGRRRRSTPSPSCATSRSTGKRRSGCCSASRSPSSCSRRRWSRSRLGRSWQASWWEWHVLMLLAFGVIAVMAHREGSEERFGRLYLDRDGTVR